MTDPQMWVQTVAWIAAPATVGLAWCMQIDSRIARVVGVETLVILRWEAR